MINTKKEVAPYGQWPSRITPEMTGSLLEISQPAWSADGTLFWWERFSTKTSINSRNPETGEIISLTGDYKPGGELMYGGGAFGLSNNALYFFDKITHQLFRANLLDSISTPLTSTLINAGSPTLSPKGDFVIFVHSNGESDGIFIQVLDSPQDPTPLVTRSDFFNYPRWHPDGRQITWISWDHPHMPWDSSSLWLGSIEINQGEKPRLVDKTLIAGGAGIAVLQPEFSPDGRYLAYISDQDGWWQLYLVDLSTGNHQQMTNVPYEHGLPPWLQNQKSYGFSPDGDRIYFLRNQEGFRSLWWLDIKKGTENQIQLDENYTWLDDLIVSPREDKIALVASRGDSPPRLITILPDGKTEIIRLSSPDPLPCNIYSLPRAISWKSDGGYKIQGLFYTPENPCFTGTGKPPLLVNIHSGPTRQKWAEFQPRTQFFTSRGFAVLEVNYRGSSGYGRDYRQVLKGNWGLVDVEDCLSGATFVADQGWVNREKMFLMGSSSGGCTVYQTLVRYPGVFKAGIVLYGIVNHLTLLGNPPKFERHYADWLIGPYPEAADLYHKRSPIFFAENIQDPIAIFQGGKDPIVPRDQADQIVNALKSNGIPHLYRLYPDESHGFKRKESLEDFYQQVELFLMDHLAN